MIARDKIHIDRIKEELNFIGKTLENINKETFLKNNIIQHAICMAFITVGECANHLSQEFKENHSGIEWIQIIAVRNIAAHGYWELNMEQIWQATKEDIPGLKKFFDNF